MRERVRSIRPSLVNMLIRVTPCVRRGIKTIINERRDRAGWHVQGSFHFNVREMLLLDY